MVRERHLHLPTCNLPPAIHASGACHEKPESPVTCPASDLFQSARTDGHCFQPHQRWHFRQHLAQRNQSRPVFLRRLVVHHPGCHFAHHHHGHHLVRGQRRCVHRRHLL